MFFTSANRANSVVSDWLLLLLLLLLPAADVSGNINDAAQRATNYRPTLSVCSMHRSTTAKKRAHFSASSATKYFIQPTHH